MSDWDFGMDAAVKAARAGHASTEEHTMLDGLVGESHPFPDTRDEDARLDRLGSTLVLRWACQHDCCKRHQARVAGDPSLRETRCTSRNHRRDRTYADEILAMLDLSGRPATQDDYVKPVTYHALGRREAREWNRG
jgi:hypothetical protein